MNPEDILNLKEHFNERFDLMQVRINERFELLETRIGMQFDSCQKLCFEKIEVVDEKVEKHDERMDRHKKSIECLEAHKNKEIGFRNAIAIGMATITIILSYLGLKEMRT